MQEMLKGRAAANRIPVSWRTPFAESWDSGLFRILVPDDAVGVVTNFDSISESLAIPCNPVRIVSHDGGVASIIPRPGVGDAVSRVVKLAMLILRESDRGVQYREKEQDRFHVIPPL